MLTGVKGDYGKILSSYSLYVYFLYVSSPCSINTFGIIGDIRYTRTYNVKQTTVNPSYFPCKLRFGAIGNSA